MKPPSPRQTVLIIDDTPSNLGIAVNLLDTRGYRVAVAQDGEEGLERARLILPDLILLDIMMPGIDGFEVCRQLKADPATTDIPVIFMTALNDIEHKLQGFKVGGVDYVTKPLQLEEIAVRVETHLKLRAAQFLLQAQNAELAMHRDKLEQLVAERTAALSAANEDLSLKSHALNQVHEAAYLTDENGRILYVNDESCRTLAYTHEELLGMTVMDIAPAWTVENWAKRWQDLRLVGMRTHEGMHRRKDGSAFPVEVQASYFEYGGRAYLLALVRDITERKRIETALAASEREFRTLAENMPDFIARYDNQGRKTYLNSALVEMIGDADAAQLGKTPFESMPGNMPGLAEYGEKLRRTLLTGQAERMQGIVSRGARTGEIHDLRFVAERTRDGEIVGALVFSRDISELKAKERQLEESRDLLRELAARRDTAREEERKRIAREIHDELGQMLTALRLDIATLKFQFGAGNPVLGQRCQHLVDIADQTIQVVRNVAAALRPAALDMGITAAIGWLVAEFQTRTGIVCHLWFNEDDIDLPEEESIAVFRIVQESLTNVARYAEADQVEITIENAVDRYRLSIRDDGKGFDPEQQRGKSFGLVGIRERALLLHGEAHIVSAPGRGTAIEIIIPHSSTRSPKP